MTEEELQFISAVSDQVELAIAQSILLHQVRQQVDREARINRVSALLHTLPNLKLEAALEETARGLQGCGGRLYLLATEGRAAEFYVWGEQPTPLIGSDDRQVEQHLMWQQYLKSPGEEICKVEASQDSGAEPWSVPRVQSDYTPDSERPDPDCWAIPDVYQEPLLRSLAGSFRSTTIRGLLIVPLRYGDQLLGCLSVFRTEVETERLWAGQCENDRRQVVTQLSFETWRELRRGQTQPWTEDDKSLAQALGSHFATAAQQYHLYRQVQRLNAGLEVQVQERTAKLEQVVEQQQALSKVVAKIRASLDLDTIFQTTTQEVCQLLETDRVAVYRFEPDWSGKFVYEFVLPGWVDLVGAQQAWADTHLQETQGGRYRHNETFAVDDLHQSGHSACHLEALERFQVRAYAIAPILVGDRLWGLLGAYQNTGPRSWQASEINLLSQVGAQLGVALQQSELLVQKQQRTRELKQLLDQQRALLSVVIKVHDSLDLDVIFQSTTDELRSLLHSDRVVVYRFNEDWSGELIAESVGSEWGKLVSGTESETEPDLQLRDDLTQNDRCSALRMEKPSVRDTYLQETQGGVYARGSQFRQVNDIYEMGFSACYIEELEAFQCRAYVIVPIFQGAKLWGLLATYQNSDARQWQPSEVELMVYAGVQLGVATQQAELLSQTQQQANQLTGMLEDLKKTQSQLIQTEKMSSLGQLVAGVAHEINNPVNFINGNLLHAREYAEDLLDLLKLYQQHHPDPHPEVHDRMEHIDLDFITEDLPKIMSSMQLGADRIRQIVLSLRNFSRLDQAEVKPADIHEGLDSTLLILRHRLKAVADVPEIEVIKEYGPLPRVVCYPGQLNQVFMNILSNAIDALEERDQGRSPQSIQECPSRILIRTQIVTPEDSPQSFVVIRIADNGPGMSEATQSRLFDPFFTTKPIGRGTGLGLTISYQIIREKHKGNLRCLSKVGKGTEFQIQIPLL